MINAKSSITSPFVLDESIQARQATISNALLSSDV
jgi:hypothetical protein